MKARRNPKVWWRHDIERKRQKIGYIQLVSYLQGDAHPHLEFSIDEEYQNQGIMSKELPKYLKNCKKYGNNQLIAVVMDNNTPSIKVLEKVGFIKVANIGNKISYIIDLNLTPSIVKAMVTKIYEVFPSQKYD